MALETGNFLDDLVVTNPVGNTDQKKFGDDHLRLIKTVAKATFPGMAGRAWRTQSKAATYAPAATDNMSVIKCTAGLTLNFAAAATLGNGWMAIIIASGGDVLLDPDSTELIAGATTVSIENGQTVLVLCDGSAFSVFGFAVMNAGGTFDFLNGLGVGKHTVPVPAVAMKPSVTDGCADVVSVATGAGMPDIISLDFDPTTSESCQFSISMPTNWDEGPISFAVVWSHAATTVNFGTAWGLSAVAVGDNETMAVAFGTEVVVTKTGGITNNKYESNESDPVTVAGAPAAGDLVCFKVTRLPDNAADNLGIDARLQHIRLYITTDSMVG